eukprot:Sspe_Gene.5000::Locus_1643_Transcript_1_1_Confidence_1.000_Length_4473::g.5000::m.5000/K02320/POLA1; DNA polymerase alpha subunit A
MYGTGGSHTPGTVYLFGKLVTATGQIVSCCVRVHGLRRQVYMLPKDDAESEDGDAKTSMLQLQREVSSFLQRRGVSKRVIAVKTRWYAFEEEGVPRDQCKWLKISYDAKHPPLGFHTPTDVQKHLENISHAFGDGRSFLEMFLLKRRLYGPCWLDVSDFVPVQEGEKVSYCAVELDVPSYKTVKKAPDCEAVPSPLLTVMSIGLSTSLVERGSTKANEIVGLSTMTYRNVSPDGPSPPQHPQRFAAVRGLGGPLPMEHLIDRECHKAKIPPPSKENSERQVLFRFLEEVERQDPDIIVGHSFLSFDLDVLLHRMDKLKVPHWSRMSRLQLKHMPKLQGGAGGTGEATWEERNVMAGRLIADSYLLSREYYKSQNYKLRALSAQMELHGVRGLVTEQDVDLYQIPDIAGASQNPSGLVELILRADDKALLSWRVIERLQAIPLTKRLTALAGNLWAKTLTGSRAERIEHLLLHKFHERKYVVPDKRRMKQAPTAGKRPAEDEQEETGKRKAKYSGGLVLEPKRGLYTDYVLLLDFNSLYPSIIQEYKVCFTTVDRPEGDDTPSVPEDDRLLCSKCAESRDPNAPLPKGIEDSCPHRCILPRAIRELVMDRRSVKRQLGKATDELTRASLDIRQKALKLTANSIYGCLGFEHSRFYAQPLAQLVTQQGREALSSTVELVEGMKEATSLQVIYGDTDSVMLSTGITASLREAIQLAHKVKSEVNRRYTNLEIDIDGVFRSILLVRKKKYAALVVKDWQGEGKEFTKEVKGLDLVRRDWCPLSCEVQDYVLDCCLSGRDQEAIMEDILGYLQGVAKRLHCEEGAEPVPLESLLIRKSLTKDPDAYVDAAQQPHVQVALRMRRKALPVQVGDIIPYVICQPAEESEGGTKQKLAHRAHHPDEVAEDATLKMDAEWYLAVQLHPPVARLCEHIRGLDSHTLSHALGIQDSKLVQHATSTPLTASAAAEYAISAQMSKSLDERFPNRREVRMFCLECKAVVVVDPHSAMLREAEKVVDHVVSTTARSLPHAGKDLLVCGKCGAPLNLKLLFNCLVHQVRQMLRVYYSSPYGIETHYSSTTNDLIEPQFRERTIREQAQYLYALFNRRERSEVAVNYVMRLEPEKAAKLSEAFSAHSSPASASLLPKKELAARMLSHLGSLLKRTDEGLQQIATYTKHINDSVERNTVDISSLFSLIRTKGSMRPFLDPNL